MNLNAYGVEELSHTETIENEGGLLPILPILVGGAIALGGCAKSLYPMHTPGVLGWQVGMAVNAAVSN
ncbi:MAG: hypothetical protein SFU27_01050 [Thermonemataceae bacterium]|nr:hypothetical protein [Thermonemataceae bacterium]